jgi:glycosyltransferase involved in cell wall biosynthesis
MKIAIITPVYSIAGVPLAQYRFARALVNQGHDVELIIGHLPTKISPPTIADLKITILNKSTVSRMLMPLVRAFKFHHYEIIFSAEDHLNVVVLIAAMLSGSKAKISGSSRVTPFDTYSNIWFSKRWILKILTKLTMKRAQVLSCVSKDMIQQYKKIFINPPHQCIYNIVDDSFSRAQMLEQVEHDWFNLTGHKIVIASGKLASWKGFEDLIRAIPITLMHSKVKLLILGDGELKDHLNNLIQELGLEDSVQLLGYVSNPLKYYKRSDIFVLSSYVEGLPNVLVEAMMCGCTPVSTNCPTGPREVLNDGEYGYLVPVGDSMALAQGIIKAIEHPIDSLLLDKAVKPFEESHIVECHFKALGY